MSEQKFWLMRDGEWVPVDKAEYVRAERAAGFHNTMGQPDEPATASFGGPNGERGTTLDPASTMRIEPSSFWMWSPPPDGEVVPDYPPVDLAPYLAGLQTGTLALSGTWEPAVDPLAEWLERSVGVVLTPWQRAVADASLSPHLRRAVRRGDAVTGRTTTGIPVALWNTGLEAAYSRVRARRSRMHSMYRRRHR